MRKRKEQITTYNPGRDVIPIEIKTMDRMFVFTLEKIKIDIVRYSNIILVVALVSQ